MDGKIVFKGLEKSTLRMYLVNVIVGKVYLANLVLVHILLSIF